MIRVEVTVTFSANPMINRISLPYIPNPKGLFFLRKSPINRQDL